MFDELAHRFGEGSVENARKGLAGVVDENAHQREGIVLPRRDIEVIFAEISLDGMTALGGCGGRRLSSLDDWGEEENLVPALLVKTFGVNTCTNKKLRAVSSNGVD